jgi:hypothetical protein
MRRRVALVLSLTTAVGDDGRVRRAAAGTP